MTKKFFIGNPTIGFDSSEYSPQQCLLTIRTSNWSLSTENHLFYIPQVSHTKYLGIVINENLKWAQHVNMHDHC